MGWTAWTESSLGDARGFPWRLLHPLGTTGWDGQLAKGFPWRPLHLLGTRGWTALSCDYVSLSDPCTLTPRVAWDDVLGCPEDQQSDKPTPSAHLGMSLHILTHPRMASMAVLPSWDVLGRIISMTSPMSGMSYISQDVQGWLAIAVLPSWDVLGRISSMTSPCPTYPRMASIALLPSWDVLGRISSMTSPCPTYPRMASIAVLPLWDVLGRCLACPYMSWEGSAVWRKSPSSF